MKKASATGDGDVPLCVWDAARKWAERNGEMTERAAAAYFELALWAIRLAEEPGALRQWWTDEQVHRDDYGLSQAQIDRLVKACREHIGLLEGQRTIRPSRSLEPGQRDVRNITGAGS
ncbi:hypothetical protein [Bradyrhizobium sp. 150]|uniref:hypothetical protein n=1 Tax=Bradyrhizobium sp. 150 TaxID=2782625 RepID=UPI001FF8006F|nr:hypothetical protein [Bradyrhizobium sp. 150]MCK1677761.1 hypothetical protein [Bradyrhizobium sp. 150]